MNPLVEAELKRQKDVADGQLPPGLTLEQLCEDADYAALPISNVQRALCRIADGREVDASCLDAEELREHLGVEADHYAAQAQRPRVVVVNSGRRSGKTLIAVLGGLLLNALTCQMRRPAEPHEFPGPDGMVGVRPGEFVRGVIVTPRKQQARAAFRHLVGALKHSKKLKRFMVPGSDNLESVIIRRPDGYEVTIEILAASAQGVNLRGSWFVGAVLDEADFFDEEDAAISLGDQIDAITPALCVGAQIWAVSSPWSDDGQFYRMHSEAFGKPGRVVAFHSSSMAMNPTINRAEIEEQRAKDPEYVAREYDAVPMTSAGQAFFPMAAIVAACSRAQLTLPPDGSPHWGGGDLGFRKNSSTAAFAKAKGGKAVLSVYDELIPTKAEPLKPSVVCSKWAKLALAYRASSIRGDKLYQDTALDELPKEVSDDGRRVHYDPWPDGIGSGTYSTAEAVVFTEFRRLMLEGLLELPNDPRLIKQLKDTKSRKLANGQTGVLVPKHGAAHGDVMIAVVLACTQVPLNDGGADVWETSVPNDTGAFRFGGVRGF